MRKIMLILVMFAGIKVQAQLLWEKIEGNGQIKKETRNTGNYTTVSSAGFWDINLVFGESGSIVLEGDENILPYIETIVEDGNLKIRLKKRLNLRTKNRIIVTVPLKKMTGIALSGSGNIRGEGQFFNEGKTKVWLSGSGKIDIQFQKTNSIEAGISGSGGIRLSGIAQSVEVKISGSGNADLSKLKAEEATAHISGSGDIELNASKSIEARISGSGNISYSGSAEEVRKHLSGSGKLIKNGK